ncbi:helix-turn-helix transcriptional regulator [Pseudomonas sp. NY15181]|uniref:helix-turn-helix transcriptional regulator n=1 Tax=Pseudomonas sp. NY15181 TaxID=3400349 RepID=UPI003A8582D1
MNELKRRHALLNMLPPKASAVDTNALYERLNEQGMSISKRTLQRDLAWLLDEYELQVHRKETGQGYRWWATRSLAHLNLLPTDAMNLTMIMDHASRFGMQAQVDNLATLRNYARSVLKDARPTEDWSKKIISTTRFITLHPGRVDATVLSTLQQSLLDNCSVEALYVPRGAQEPKTYRLKPLGLSYQDSNIYLSCVFENHRPTDRPRALPLHRFVSVKTIFYDIKAPEAYDINSIEARYSLVDLKSDASVGIRLRLRKEMFERLVENPLTDDQQLVQETDDRWLMTGSLLPSQGLKLWLLGQGDLLEVLEPLDMRDDIAATALRTAALYDKATAT